MKKEISKSMGGSKSNVKREVYGNQPYLKNQRDIK